MAHGPQHILSSVLFGCFLVWTHTSGDFVIDGTLHDEFLFTSDWPLRDDLINGFSFFGRLLDLSQPGDRVKRQIGEIFFLFFDQWRFFLVSSLFYKLRKRLYKKHYLLRLFFLFGFNNFLHFFKNNNCRLAPGQLLALSLTFGMKVEPKSCFTCRAWTVE